MATAETPADGIDDRDVRAAEEPMAIVQEAPGLMRVYSGTDSQYTVDAQGPACECGDFTYRAPAEGCKHIRRVKMALGIRDVPEGVNTDPALAHQREAFANE